MIDAIDVFADRCRGCLDVEVSSEIQTNDEKEIGQLEDVKGMARLEVFSAERRNAKRETVEQNNQSWVCCFVVFVDGEKSLRLGGP
jgi:hypothetical protein